MLTQENHTLGETQSGFKVLFFQSSNRRRFFNGLLNQHLHDDLK